MFILPPFNSGISIIPAYPDGVGSGVGSGSGSGSGSGFEPSPANCFKLNVTCSVPAVTSMVAVRSLPVLAVIRPVIDLFPCPEVGVRVHQVSLQVIFHSSLVFIRRIKLPPLAFTCV